MSVEMRKAVYAETAKRIKFLLQNRETGSGKAALANLRRGIGLILLGHAPRPKQLS